MFGPRKRKQTALRIIIVGCGKVGHTLTEQLVREGHDITVVDTDSHVLSNLNESYDVMTVSGNGASRQVLESAGMTREQMDFVLATGYGRNSLDGLADMQMSELSCHARGAAFLFPNVRTVVDIGGQDVKVIEIENGQMRNFVMNDKCAAGTGRFLDVMARVLEVKVEDLGDLGDRSTKEVGISSTCTVFAESEVISQLANGVKRPDLVAGICRSVASRVAALARRAGVTERVCLSGGVAQNDAVRQALSDELNVPVSVDPLAQYFGAIGAALWAYKQQV